MATIKDLMNLTIREFESMGRQQLAKVVSQMSSAANKRIKRMQQQGQESPAYKKAMESGGNFRVKGKTLNQLRSEYARVRDFLGMKTSTLLGWKKVKRDFKKRMQTDVDVYDEEYKDYWDFYQMYGKYIVPQVRGSVDLQKVIYDIWDDNKGLSKEEQIKKFEDALEDKWGVQFKRDKEYEKQINKWFKIENVTEDETE